MILHLERVCDARPRYVHVHVHADLMRGGMANNVIKECTFSGIRFFFERLTFNILPVISWNYFMNFLTQFELRPPIRYVIMMARR